MSEIKFDIKRTGFPVEVGEVELWFDSSVENLTRLSGIEKEVNKELKKLQNKYKNVKLPKNIESLGSLDPKNVSTAFEINKDFVKIQFDVVFGKGSFNKVYEKHSDVLAINEVLKQMSDVIAERIKDGNIE